jgi:hypothetical protein
MSKSRILSLADYLAQQAHLNHNHIRNSKLDVDEAGLHIFYRLSGKDYHYIIDNLWDEATRIYDTLVATSMLNKGYLPIPLNNGAYIIVSPEGEEYQLEGQSCSCLDFLNRRPVDRCKHLRLRDYLQHLQVRSMQYLDQRVFPSELADHTFHVPSQADPSQNEYAQNLNHY